MYRSGSYVRLVVTALAGLVSIVGAFVLVMAGNRPYGPVPFALFGTGLVVLAPLSGPQRWNGKPEEKEIVIGGAPVRALVFPFALWRFAVLAAFMLLVTLGGLLGVLLGLSAGAPGFAVAMGVWVVVMAPMAVMAVRRFALRKHLALTADRLYLRVPTGRIDVAWQDVASVDLLPVGDHVLYGITLAPGAGAPAGRAVTRLRERFGADAIVQADWLSVHPDEVMDAFTRHLPGGDGRDGAVIG